MKSLAPCAHFTAARTCALGYQPDEHCALCQLYQSDWAAPAEKLVNWLALFKMDVTSHPAQPEQPKEQNRTLGKWTGSSASDANIGDPREADA